MWNQLGVFGSRVVEAISVAAVEAPRMEGHDATSLIASRLGVDPGEVTAKLVSLHQKNELNGAADGRSDDDENDGVVAEAVNVNVSLTVGDLEDFKRFEKATAAEKLLPAKLKMRPAVLGATPTKPASAAPASASRREVVQLELPAPVPAPAPSTATAQMWHEDDDEVEMLPEDG
jgi:hypothetical protein